MNTKEIKDIVLNSQLSDWSYNDERGIYTYQNDVNITIKRDDFDLEKEFKEPWVEKYEDPVSYSVRFEVLYSGDFVEEKYFALVDGAIMYIPYPKSTSDLIITEEDYKFGLLINLATNYDFDDYLEKSGIVVEYNEFSKQNNITINNELIVDEKIGKEEKKTNNNLNTVMNFEFREKIGEGGFADVWKAIDNLGREVAIKIFKPSAVFVSDEANLQNTISKMLLNHAILLAQVEHNNVVRIYYITQTLDPVQNKPVHCIVMELLEGITLEKRLETVLSIDESSFIGNGIIEGMFAIHNSNIAHNDFHSQNIMLSNKFVKIIDPRYDESTFTILSSMAKEQLFKSDIRFLKEILRDIIYKTPEISMDKGDEFRNKTRNENDMQKIREIFNDTLAKKFEANSNVMNNVNTLISNNSTNKENNIVEKIKEYISDDKYRIKLDDLIMSELRNIVPKLNNDLFPLNEPQPNSETISERLNSYKTLTPNLETIMISLAHWGNNKQLSVFNKILLRISDTIELEGGKVYWLKLRWYPLFILAYCSGISAIYSDNYEYLYSLFLCKTQDNNDSYHEKKYLINSLAKNLTQLDRGDEIFKMIPEHKNNYVPVSEYMFNRIQPILEEYLFLGKSYDNLFDRFEIFFALVYADINNIGYGPTGRFIYKSKPRYGMESKDNPFNDLINEADLKKDSWEPLKAGFFNGSYDRFIEVSNNYKKFMESFIWY